MPTTALHTAWQLLITLDPQLLAIVARSLGVSALACTVTRSVLSVSKSRRLSLVMRGTPSSMPRADQYRAWAA